MFNMNLEPQEAGLEGCAAIFSSSPSYECGSESLKKCSRNDWEIPRGHEKHWWIWKSCKYEWNSVTNYQQKRVQSVKIKTTGAERLHFTVALTAGVKKAENEFTLFLFLPLLIFKVLVKAPPGKYPAGMTVFGSKGGEGAMKCSMMKKTYLKRIWKRKPGGFFNTEKSILLMDSGKSHLGDKVVQAFTDVSSSIRLSMLEWHRYCSF